MKGNNNQNATVDQNAQAQQQPQNQQQQQPASNMWTVPLKSEKHIISKSGRLSSITGKRLKEEVIRLQ